MQLKLLFIFCILFFMGCGGPIYRINSDTDQEAGLLSVCWMSDGRADYSTHPLCENPEEINIGHTPIIVSSSFTNENLNSAINWINSELDCELFQYDSRSSHPDVRVYLDAPLPYGAEYHGSTSHVRLAGGQIVANIATYMMTSIDSIQYTLEHELLHAAGLAHDDFDYSVMMSYSRQSWVYHITTHDRRLLRERYCGTSL